MKSATLVLEVWHKEKEHSIQHAGQTLLGLVKIPLQTLAQKIQVCILGITLEKPC